MAMKKMIRLLLPVALVLGAGMVSCSKNEEPEEKKVETTPEEVAYLQESIGIVTKSITTVSLEDLALFIKGGEAPGSIYLDLIYQDEISLVKGEVGRIATEYGPCITLDVTILDAIPVTGNVLVKPLAKGMLELTIFKNDPARCAEAIALVNEAVDVQFMGVYELTLLPAVDPETGESTTEWCLVFGDSIISINELIAIISQLS